MKLAQRISVTAKRAINALIDIYCTSCRSSVSYLTSEMGGLGHRGRYVSLQHSSMVITADRHDPSALEKHLNTLHVCIYINIYRHIYIYMPTLNT